MNNIYKLEKYDLRDVLKQCKKSASRGYDIAVKQEKSLNSTLDSAKNKIQETIDDFNTSPCYVSDATNSLETQLIDVEKSFDLLSLGLKKDLKQNKKNLSKFSITLFGRTMAGKSTLMEILTNGDGSSIGLGAQRTTRDVRKYKWNNMEITDVPGIGAFEGQEDEDIAFEAAKVADLIIFMITDDAPQVAEAECLGRIINLGKPVICVMNVKVAVSEGKSIKLTLRDIEKRFDKERLNLIKEQFLLYSKQLGQEWGYIPFVYVHLKAAFISQHMDDSEKAETLYKVSCVEFLKKSIIEQVRNRGRFYRIRTFVDLISNPMMSSIDMLLEQSLVNSMEGRTILAKNRNLTDWREKFQRDCNKQIESLVININSQLNLEIVAFAEEHFSDKNADKAWIKLMESKEIDSKCQELLDKFEQQCNEKTNEIAREIINELKFTSQVTSDKSLKMQRILDGKKAWNWTTTILGGGLTIGATIAWLAKATIALQLGWATIGIAVLGVIGSFFFKSRDKYELLCMQK